MIRQEDPHVFAGMQQDLEPAKMPSSYLCDAHNIRFTVNGSNTFLSVTNERGPKSMEAWVTGIYLGHCVLNNYIVVFTTWWDDQLGANGDWRDTISRIEVKENSIEVKELYQVDYDTPNNINNPRYPLGFSLDHPIETLAYYETDKVLKVYWVDGLNLPRFINIVSTLSQIDRFNANSFLFVLNLSLQEVVKVEKISSLQGTFAPGTIQYAFSYYNMFGQESNIFYTTPLIYITYSNRGGSPEDKCGCIFRITIENVDTSFDYIKVYSIQRTTLDGTPLTKVVTDIKIGDNTTISTTDTGMYGETIDPQLLLYVGGEEINASTLCQKDNTLFLGNIQLKMYPVVLNELNLSNLKNIPIICDTRKMTLNTISEAPYPYYSGLQTSLDWNTSGFKHGEYYRLGILFQYKNGKWSLPMFIGDKQQYCFPSQNGNTLRMPIFTTDYDLGDQNIEFRNMETIISAVKALGYVKARPIVVFPREEERTIICQGIVNPTLFTNRERYGRQAPLSVWDDVSSIPLENIYAWASWFFRPMSETGSCVYDETTGGVSPLSRGTLQYPNNNNMVHPVTEGYREYADGRGFEMFVCREKDRLYNIDWNLLTLNSPDLDMGNYFYNTQFDNCHFYNIGSIEIDKTLADIDVITETPPIASNATGFVRHLFVGNGSCGLISGPFYNDAMVNDYYEADNFRIHVQGTDDWEQGEEEDDSEDTEQSPNRHTYYNVYLWLREGSLNNDVSRSSAKGETKGVQSALLKTKIVSNLRISNSTYYAEDNSVEEIPLEGIPIYYRNNYDIIEKINNHIYYGNVDTLIGGDTYFGNYVLLPIFRGDSWSDMYDVYYDAPLNIKIGYPTFNSTRPDSFAVLGEACWGAIMPNPYASSNSQNDAVDSNRVTPYGITRKNGKNWVLGKIDWENGTWSVWDEIDEDAGDSSYGWCGLYYKPIGGVFGLIAKKNNVRIKFRSSPHIVFQLKDDSRMCWPNQDLVFNQETNQYEPLSDKRFPRNDNYDQKAVYRAEGVTTGRNDVNILIQGTSGLYLPVVEVRRPYNQNAMFGGQTAYALQLNTWIPAGDPIDIDDILANKLLWKYGDTWYQRYDCLKTFAYDKDDTNQVVEILSCMLESHINLEGRYDKNRGQLSNLTMSDTNFNLLNPAYGQQDDFFNYKILPEEIYNSTSFNNQFIWSLEKHPASDIDAWTNVNMGSSYNLDGSLGAITSIVTNNNQLYAFQLNGVSNILFNSRVLIQTSDGLPIEISNNYKVEGCQYITTTIGCLNSKAICPTHYGIYFLDSLGGELQLLSDKKIENISTLKGVTLWFRRQANKQWTPRNYTTRLFYDRQDQDIYIVSPDESLLYSEKLQSFTSFMSYSEIPAMFNIKNSFYVLNAIPVQKETLALYKMFAGLYNNFFGQLEGYDLSFISNGVQEKQNNAMLSKVFTNLDFRADTWENGETTSGYPQMIPPFNYIRVNNEYQDTYQVPLTFKVNTSSAKEKFRIWRIDIPRNKKQEDKKRSGIMDRIRNPWCRIRLSNTNPEQSKIQLHDMNVSYFI